MTVLCPDDDGSSEEGSSAQGCADAHKAVPTVMLASLAATVMVGVAFLVLGKLRITPTLSLPFTQP